MNIKDELHDLKLLGWREYWWLAYGSRADQRREDRIKRRAERADKRVMRTSTFDALASTYEEDPYDLPQEVLEDLIEDTIEVNRRRVLERTTWLMVVVTVAAAAFGTGWYLRPLDEPEPMVCDVTLINEGEDVTNVRCTGVYE